MQRFGRHSAAAQRAQERREREDSAPRLATEVPDLLALRLEIEERSDGAAVSQPKYVRRVVVPNAPALFLIPCGDANCEGGGHDVTGAVMHALHDHQTGFAGEDYCRGSLGSANCSRILHYEATAEYKKS